MADPKTIDLLKVAAGGESSDLEACLGGEGAVVSEPPFPEAFLASGNATMLSSTIRVLADERGDAQEGRR